MADMFIFSFDDTVHIVSASLQLVALIFAARVITEVKDRRPWFVLFAALAVMFVFRCLALVFRKNPEILQHYQPFSALAVSILLLISLFYIRRIAIAERESERRYRGLVELSPDAMFVNAGDHIVYLNIKAVQLFGATDPSQLLGRSPLEFIAPESKELVLSRIEQLAGPDVSMPAVEQYWLRLDGTRVAVEAAAASIPWKGGQAIQVILRDISERKRAEDEKAKLLASERVARSNAEHANRMKDQFLATLSHELRTPLNAILGWSQLLRTGTTEKEELDQGLDTIERNARVQTQLIEDLLDMSRIISGKLRLDIQSVVPSSFIKAAIETVRPAAEAKQIRLEPLLDPSAGPVSGDPNRLQQIVWNLLSNAVKFTPRGGRVNVQLARVNSSIEITVSDTGQGIDPDFLPFMFERFRQQDATTTRRHGGLGLGLSIVKQLVDLHGGVVEASSQGTGQGATFRVRLPLTVVHTQTDDGTRLHPAADLAGTPGGPTHADLSGLKVLVVDDEPDARDLIKRVLNGCGAQSTTAASAGEALQMLDGIDVLISDIGMPDIDGYEFLRRVRALKTATGRKLPAIALTAFARSEDRTRALIAGYQVHISKPVSAAELIATVASVAGRT
jgi:PAS domain S-box-containing protein